MNRTRRTFFYPAFYLTTSGLGLLFAPDLTLRLFFSNGHYGDVMPRMAGAVVLALAVLVIQVIRHRAEALYPTIVGVRVMLCAAWMGLYLYTRDPFFLAVFAMVAAGMVWSAVSLRFDRIQPADG